LLRNHIFVVTQKYEVKYFSYRQQNTASFSDWKTSDPMQPTLPPSRDSLPVSARQCRSSHEAADEQPLVIIDERVRVNFTRGYVMVNEQRVLLTPIETRLLQTLYQQRGRALSPGYLMTHTWTADDPGTVASLWVHLHRLRTKLEQNPARPQYILTRRGQGYYLPHPPASGDVMHEPQGTRLGQN
jgi:DNA-binding winged helix-turn-helix (wHTH) protein